MPRSSHRSSRSANASLVSAGASSGAAKAAEAELLAELARIYADADAAFAGWSCPASTECCRFGVTGREPYVTSIELLALRRAVASLGGLPALASKRALPLVAERGARDRDTERGARDRDTERACPMLNAQGRCAVYAARPLGCRTFYCDRASAAAPVKHKAITELVRRVKDLASRHAQGGDLGRPLTRAL